MTLQHLARHRTAAGICFYHSGRNRLVLFGLPNKVVIRKRPGLSFQERFVQKGVWS